MCQTTSCNKCKNVNCENKKAEEQNWRSTKSTDVTRKIKGKGAEKGKIKAKTSKVIKRWKPRSASLQLKLWKIQNEAQDINTKINSTKAVCTITGCKLDNTEEIIAFENRRVNSKVFTSKSENTEKWSIRKPEPKSSKVVKRWKPRSASLQLNLWKIQNEAQDIITNKTNSTKALCAITSCKLDNTERIIASENKRNNSKVFTSKDENTEANRAKEISKQGELDAADELTITEECIADTEITIIEKPILDELGESTLKAEQFDDTEELTLTESNQANTVIKVSSAIDVLPETSFFKPIEAERLEKNVSNSCSRKSALEELCSKHVVSLEESAKLSHLVELPNPSYKNFSNEIKTIRLLKTSTPLIFRKCRSEVSTPVTEKLTLPWRPKSNLGFDERRFALNTFYLTPSPEEVPAPPHHWLIEKLSG